MTAPPPDRLPAAEVAVIGGSGFYSFLSDPEVHELSTPYGDPSAPIATGIVAGRRVAFVPRHGAGHALPPHAINYRANLWALRALGVRQVIAPCAVGGLSATLEPGAIVVPDQVVDRTSGRPSTFVSRGAVHAPFADPYCARLRAVAATVDGVERSAATMVVIEGPRFSSRAESQWYAAQGWSLVNMTGLPEAALARELGQCYLSVALVTDLDAGLAEGQGVSQEEVFAAFADNLGRLKSVVSTLIERLPEPSGCDCATWADGLDLDYLP